MPKILSSEIDTIKKLFPVGYKVKGHPNPDLGHGSQAVIGVHVNNYKFRMEYTESRFPKKYAGAITKFQPATPC